MGVGDHQFDALEPPRTQPAEEGQPTGTVLGSHHVEAQDLTPAVLVDTHDDETGHVDDAALLAALHLQRVEPEYL